MDDIPALVQEGGKVVDILPHADLSGFGVGAVFHALIKHVKGNALAQIVRIILAVDLIMEADIVNIPRFKMLFAEVRSRAAAQNITHGSPDPFAFIPR